MRRIFFVLAAAAIFLILLQTDSHKPVTVSLVGDILLGRGVGSKIAMEGKGYPYEKIRNELKTADIVYGNLECPLTLEGTPLLKNRNLVFRADPENAVLLKNAGFNILNLANNHTMDYGPRGLENTMNALQKEGISVTGGGSNGKKAHEPVFITKSGMRIGFLGYSSFPPEGYFYLEDQPNIAHIAGENFQNKIRKVRENCDFLVVTFHWGKEFDFLASESQKQLAHLAIDCGADAVVGHHPHVLQGMEMYKGKFIAYSLGNFIFDRQIPDGTDETVIAKLLLTKEGIMQIELVPVRIADSRPEPAKTEDAQHILERLRLYSEGMNGRVEMKGSRGYLR